MASIPLCHRGYPGSIPGHRASLKKFICVVIAQLAERPLCKRKAWGSIPHDYKLFYKKIIKILTFY